MNVATAAADNWAGWAVIAVIVIHLSAVVRHRLQRDETLGSMAPAISKI
ncbi:MAG: hypothetical protein KGM42_01715 [Hyphomicrobiales bacterium]|nr:hypothetical protein [Hyphomicrobiales bacterium]